MANKTYQSSSITINFSTISADKYLSVELDSDLNNGKSTFVFGSSAYFKIYTNASTI